MPSRAEEDASQALPDDDGGGSGRRPRTPADLKGNPRRLAWDRNVKRGLALTASVAIVISILIVTSLLFEGTRFFARIDTGGRQVADRDADEGAPRCAHVIPTLVEQMARRSQDRLGGVG